MTMAEHKNQDVLNQFMCGYRSVAKRFAALAEETGSCWRTTKTSSAHAFFSTCATRQHKKSGDGSPAQQADFPAAHAFLSYCPA
ncbi:hypothetical protein [Erwinia sp. PsM31]|uniref:hypothetical protein n=1 Tax=Erwinia sp. PsM31 TaxID=3030535 RepID=UPI00263AA01A|nr:hypothetical protein [Erwinia sp. PsM31]MDN4628312.1 hypothetical protein [Erwinia sp. PsM31]